MALRRTPLILLTISAVLSTLLVGAWYYRDFASDYMTRVIDGFTADKTTNDTDVNSVSKPNYDFDKAHTIPSADAFKDEHFEQVLALPGLTISDTKQSCNWTASEKVNYMFGDDVDWAQNDRSDKEIEQHRREWQDFVRNDLIPYKDVKSKFSGRGIVILAGNGDTLPRTKVLFRALRRLKSEVPVEVHYYGDEMDKGTMKQLKDIYPHTYFNDLASDHNIMSVGFNAFLINYQLKTAAIVNARWSEILLLDSDNIPVIDPGELWDSPTYQEYNTVFWPDIARTRPPNPAWALTNTPCRMDEFELESGQLLVNKERFWHHLQLAAHMNNDPDRYYDEFLLGDKDTFRFAWFALKTEFGRPDRWLTSVGTQNGDRYCGHTFAQHHPDDGRIAFLHGGFLKSMSPEVMQWNRDVKGGVFRDYKRASTDEDPSRLVDVGVGGDGNEYVPDLPANHTGQWCVDMYDTKSRDLEEVLPGFDKVFEELGGYWPIEDPVD